MDYGSNFYFLFDKHEEGLLSNGNDSNDQMDIDFFEFRQGLQFLGCLFDPASLSFDDESGLGVEVGEVASEAEVGRIVFEGIWVRLHFK